MRISMHLPYAGGFRESAQLVADLERVGLDQVWIGEAYTFDSISQLGYLAAVTKTVEIGTGIVNVFSRSAALMAMTFAGLDYISQGRAICGLGVSGPQVVEGFHGLSYFKPLTRLKEYTEVCRMVWRRELLAYEGQTIRMPLPAGEGSGLGTALRLINHPVRPDIPIWWASLTPRAVRAAAEMADGWLPSMLIPEKMNAVWGNELRSGLARRPAELGPLEIGSGGLLAIGDDLVGEKAESIRDRGRGQIALYVGGMGAREKNFYNELACRYGYANEAKEIQDLYLSGRKEEAASKVPGEWLEKTSFVGPASYVADRVAAYRDVGVTSLAVEPVGPDPVKCIERFREIIDS
jgi:F420-dependent oxidoreductase-like protein